MKTESFPSSEDAFRKSGFCEQLVEHAFILEDVAKLKAWQDGLKARRK